MNLIISNNSAEIRKLVSEGFCPVECSIGGESIIDDLKMDHHGKLSHLESVAIRAYRDEYGSRREDPRFVIAGLADADAVFCCLALAGLLPHPDYDVSELPKHLRASKQRDLTGLAETIAILDTDPIGQNKPAMAEIGTLLAWNALTTGGNGTSNGAVFAAQLMLQLVDGHPVRKPFIEAAFQAEAVRYEESMKALAGAEKVGNVLIIQSPVWGFEEWYQINRDASQKSLAGWENHVVLAFNASVGNFTIGCPNNAVAEELFGAGGLMNLFPKLDAFAAGWGGREAVGGSPRGLKMSWSDARALAEIINK